MTRRTIMNQGAMALALLAITAGCGGDPGADPSDREALMEQWRAELIQADQDFADAIGQGGLALWTSFFTEDGAIVQEGVGEVRGTEAMQAAMDAAAGAITSFSWKPERAEVSEGGDLGYTVGQFRTVVAGPDGVEMLTTGLYVSIWRRQEDGGWKVEMDLGNLLTEPAPVSDEGADSEIGGTPA